MPSSPLVELLKLPATDRAELALALWDSLAEGEREGELALSDEQRADLDRRWAEHVADPASAIPWADVRAKLLAQMVPRQVVFRPQAADDASEVQAWYESRRAGLGHEFGVAVDNLIERIATNPLMFHCVHGALRRAVLSRFPYAIYFRPAGDQIVVLAIHGRQHPSRWKTRT